MTPAEKLQLKARARLRLKQPAPAPHMSQSMTQQSDSTGMDMAKGFGTGLVQGAIGMAAAPAQLGQYIGKKVTGAADYLMGVNPEETAQRQAQAQASLNGGSMLPNPANLQEFGPSFQPQTITGQYANTVGQFLPSTLAGGPAGMGSKILSATTGGIGSETAGQVAKKFMPEAESYARIVGGVLGGVAPSLARRAVTPLPVSPERQALLSTLKKEGVELTAGQSSGRQGLRYFESELGGGKVANLMEKQGEQFTAAALKRAGITSNRATPEVMDKAFTRIGNQFENLGRRHSLPADARLATDVADVVTDYAALVPPAGRAPIVQKMATDLVNAAQNGMKGDAYNALTSRLARMARNNKDPQLAEALRGMRHSVDEAMERHLASIGSPDLPAWQTARKEYRNIIVLEQAAAGAGEKAAEGILSTSLLRNATVQNQGKRNYVRGEGDFADLVRAGEATMKPLPQSGTAPRTAVRAAGQSVPTLAGAALGSPAGLPGMIAGGIAGTAAPFAIGRTLLSAPMRKYLSNQLLGKSPIEIKRMIALSLAGTAPQVNYSGGR
jgi:hypothetical protein